MKYFAVAAIFLFAALQVQAQTEVPSVFSPKQRQLNDSLKVLFPNLQSKIAPVQNKMPVLPLKNEGVKIGSNDLGDIYSMQIDNLPCLKPFKTKDEMPNAMKNMQVLPVPEMPKNQP